MQQQCYKLISIVFLNYQGRLLLHLIVTIIILISLQTTGAYSGDLVIDPGHSPKLPGATSCTGKPEHLYNDSLAQYVLTYLLKQETPVSLTRKANEELSLNNRASAAANKKLILSIHHDSVQPLFITWKNHRPTSTKAEGYSIFVSSKNRYYEQSLKYAHRLGAALRSRGLTPSKHHGEKIAGENRQLLDSEQGIYLFDDLVVLKKTDAPSILFEAAVIVNPQDEARATSEQYKLQIAEAILEMIE
jgi:N-acetylmuramoyl-L-alanine amidase